MGVLYVWCHPTIAVFGVPDTPILIQLLANVLRRTVNDGPGTLVPANHGGDLDEALGFLMQSGPDLAIVEPAYMTSSLCLFSFLSL